MYIPFVWQLTAENALRTLRHLRLIWLRNFPHIRRNKKAWSY